MQTRWCLCLVIAATSCRKDTPADRSVATPTAAGSAVTSSDAVAGVDAAPPAPVDATGGVASARNVPAWAWADRCLGHTRVISWNPEQTVAAIAAGNLVVDGTVTPPVIKPPSYAPEREFEVDWTLALAQRAVGADATALVERAFASASAIKNGGARDRALLWGALVLDSGAAARWEQGLSAEDFRHELAGNRVRVRAEAGDLDGARRALQALPPTWGIRTDAEYWYGYPRWLGSPAAAACVALSSPAVATLPAARTLVEEAERRSSKIDESWRQNRELRTLALAWLRVGDGERALAAASRMPGSERGEALVELIGLADETIAPARLEQLARGALAATREAPLVIADSEATRADVAAAVDGLLEAALEAALARRRALRGDLAGADELIARIAPSTSARHEAALHVGCVRIARGGTKLADVLAAAPDGLLRSNLVRAAIADGCTPMVDALLPGEPHAGNLIAGSLADLISDGRLSEAAELLQRQHDRMQRIDRAEAMVMLVHRMVGAGMTREAVALFTRMPRDTDLIEWRHLIAGHMLVVALAANGAPDEARRLRDELAPRVRALPSVDEIMRR